MGRTLQGMLGHRGGPHTGSGRGVLSSTAVSPLRGDRHVTSSEHITSSGCGSALVEGCLIADGAVSRLRVP